jgi:hypothetical protein
VRALSRFKELRSLSLEGHTKDLDAVGGLTSLVDLTLRSVTLPNLEFLEPLDELRALDLKLGGTTNLDALRRVGRLQYLELWQIRGLTDISVISQMQHLEHLFLQSLRRVERLPDLSTAGELRVLWFETMKGLADLSMLPTAPALEHVALIDMGHLDPEALAPLPDCPALKSASVGLGSDRKNLRAEEILGSLVADDNDWEVWDSRSYRFG